MSNRNALFWKKIRWIDNKLCYQSYFLFNIVKSYDTSELKLNR